MAKGSRAGDGNETSLVLRRQRSKKGLEKSALEGGNLHFRLAF